MTLHTFQACCPATSAEVNDNFNTVLTQTLMNSIALVECTTVTNAQFENSIVDVFTDADGKLNTVNTGNTTMDYESLSYSNIKDNDWVNTTTLTCGSCVVNGTGVNCLIR
jgi:hypothetical protein